MSEQSRELLNKQARLENDYWIIPEAVWQNGQLKQNVAVQVSPTTGRILAIQQKESVCAAEMQKHVNGVLLPGFVNCHSHAFQLALRGKGESYERDSQDSFWTWREEMYKLVESCADESGRFFDIAKRCYMEMLNAGITTVGEFHYFRHSSPKESNRFDLDRLMLKAAAEVGIRIVLLNTFYHFRGFDEMPLSETQQHFESKTVEEFWENFDQLSATLADDKTQTLGVAAHSLRAVNVTQFKALFEEATRRKVPFHLHIEEQPAEVEACKLKHNGLTPMGLLLQSLASHDLSHVTAVHCNHTDSHELGVFSEKGGLVCICPLTEGNLGDGVISDIQKCAGSICLGTDCNARIDMLEELRWLEYSQRLTTLRRGVCTQVQSGSNNFEKQNRVQVASVLMDYATRVGAKSLGLKCGSISPGFLADFVLVDSDTPLLQGVELNSIPAAMVFGCSSSQVVVNTCVGGMWSKPMNS